MIGRKNTGLKQRSLWSAERRGDRWKSNASHQAVSTLSSRGLGSRVLKAKGSDVSEQILDVAVIGAGPAGLVLARRLQNTDASFAVFERHTDVGGIWDIDAPGSPMYETAHFISSRTHSGFADFPMPDDYPDYPDHRQLLAYNKSFAAQYDLDRHIEFNMSVDDAAQNEDGT